MRKPSSFHLKRLSTSIVIGLSYILIACYEIGLFSDGGPHRLATHYVGGGEIEGWLWRYWWLKQVLHTIWTRPGLALGTRIHLSLQSSLYPEFGNIVDLTLVSIPLEHMLGAPLYYNVKIVGVLALNGLCAYALLRSLGAHRSAAWLGGVIFGFNPYFMFELANGRMRQAIGFAMPLYALYQWRMWIGGGTRNAVLAAFWWAVASWLYLYYGMWIFFFNIVFWGWAMLWGRRLSARASPDARKASPLPPADTAAGSAVPTLDFFKNVLLMHVVALLLVLPCVMPYFEVLRGGHALHEVTYLSDIPPLSRLLSLPPGRPAPGQEQLYSMQRFIFMSLSADFPWSLGSRRVVPLGFTLLALLPLVAWRWRGRGPTARTLGLGAGALWLCCGLLFYLLSLGPYLKSGSGMHTHFVDYPPGIRMPYVSLFKYVPFFSRQFSPLRNVIMVYLSVAVLAALNLTWMTEQRRLLGLVVALLIASCGLGQMRASGSIPLSTVDLQAPTYYARLHLGPRDGLIELPFHAGDYTDYLQTVHGHKVLMGWADAGVPRGFPPGRVAWLAKHQDVMDNAFIRFLESLNTDPEHPSRFTRRSVTQLRQMGYPYMILHERGVSIFNPDPRRAAIQYEAMRRVLEVYFGPPLFDTTEIVPIGPDPDAPERRRVAVFRLKLAVNPSTTNLAQAMQKVSPAPPCPFSLPASRPPASPGAAFPGALPGQTAPPPGGIAP